MPERNKPYECQYCGKEFKSKRGHQLHERNQHSESEKKKVKKRKIKQKKKEQEKIEKKLNKSKNNNNNNNSNSNNNSNNITRENRNKMPDHIQEYFKNKESSKEAVQSRELFTADEDNIDLKTDIDEKEIRKIATLTHNDKILESNGLNPIFSKYLIKIMRLKVSKERKSRAEFVGLSSTEVEDNLKDLNKNLQPLTRNRK